MNAKIDPEFRDLCRKLTGDEFNQLEQNILIDGVRESIILWDGIIVDGHNRYSICVKHNLKYGTVDKSFGSRDDAKLWIINNQLGRRNLTDLDRVALLESKRPILEKHAKDAKISQLKQGDKVPVVPNLAPRETTGKVRDQLAKEAGVSKMTYEALRKVNREGTEELKQAVRDKKVSASKGATIAALPKEKQIEAIEEEDKPKPKPCTRLKKEDYVIISESAVSFAKYAISQLERIQNNDPTAEEALLIVEEWISNKRSKLC